MANDERLILSPKIEEEQEIVNILKLNEPLHSDFPKLVKQIPLNTFQDSKWT